jgi:hypothetical protein
MSEVTDKPVETEAKAKKPALKKYRVTINSADDDKSDVVLVHNYRQIQIMRDQEVTIDEHYLEVLKSSVVTTTVKNDKGEVVPVRIPRFSYSVEAV